jgi:hypothetical protein
VLLVHSTRPRVSDKKSTLLIVALLYITACLCCGVTLQALEASIPDRKKATSQAPTRAEKRLAAQKRKRDRPGAAAQHGAACSDDEDGDDADTARKSKKAYKSSSNSSSAAVAAAAASDSAALDDNCSDMSLDEDAAEGEGEAVLGSAVSSNASTNCNCC